MVKRSAPRRRANTHGNNIEREKLCKAVLSAAEAAGKQFGDNGLVSYLEAQAIATPSPFLTLLGKVLAEDKLSEGAKITHIEIIAPQLEDVVQNAIGTLDISEDKV
ncbi:hypothetical protein N5853_01900 [Bartonella sp. HY329]|uniref:hypothetical protein n=1 Tax=unclassified Bartonella TaxID=2645622 RepID=UPI0021C8CF78|nr:MULTISPECIES: hypothetical protein [unclassified Bartonella]UXM95421.1 hypothetical protein N5853_01900 [Bartonella sp. HY329]UXN09746.1 hypothetical protein N5852_01905 [Bartonella sp. HY328]